MTLAALARALAPLALLATPLILAACGDTLFDKATETVVIVEVRGDAASLDPSARTWSTRPSLPALSGAQTGVVAPSGRAYVTASGSAETYRFDATAAGGVGAWETLAKLPEPRVEAIAFMAGNLVCVGSGYGNNGPIAFIDVLDDAAATPSWARIPTPFRRAEMVLAGLPDRIIAVGGRDHLGILHADVWILTPVTSTAIWQPRGFLAGPRGLAGSFVLNGRLHVFAGYDDQQLLQTDEAVDVLTGAVGFPTIIPTARVAPQAVVVGDRAFVTDSRMYGFTPTTRLDSYRDGDPGNGWSLRASPPRNAVNHPSICGMGSLLVFAGGAERNESRVFTYTYDAFSDAWTEAGQLPYPAHAGFLAEVGGRPLYMGGFRVREERRKLETSDFLGF